MIKLFKTFYAVEFANQKVKSIMQAIKQANNAEDISLPFGIPA